MIASLLVATTSAADDLPFSVVKNGPLLSEYGFQELQVDGTARYLGFVELQGKPIVAVSWATWCGICSRELPQLAKLQKDFGDDIVVVALSIDEQGLSYAAETLTKRKLALRPFHDTGKMFFASIGGRGVPTSVIADRNGRVVARAVGSVQWDDPAARAFIKRLTLPVAKDAPMSSS